MEKHIKAFALASGADLIGIAGADRFGGAPEGFRPADIFDRCRSVVVLAKALPRGIAAVSPRIIYKHAMDVAFAALDRAVFETAMEIERLGGVAVPLPSTGSPKR